MRNTALFLVFTGQWKCFWALGVMFFNLARGWHDPVIESGVWAYFEGAVIMGVLFGCAEITARALIRGIRSKLLPAFFERSGRIIPT